MRLAVLVLAIAAAVAANAAGVFPAPGGLSLSARANGTAGRRLAELVPRVRSADYRGDRAELARLDQELGRLSDGALSDYRDYWRGFALWRRAINGFNETPRPDDLERDLHAALARFHSALARHPDWIEVQLAQVGCWGNLIYLAGGDAEKRKAILAESGPTFRFVMANAGDNPRALWIRGGMEFGAPPPIGGDFAKAAATLRHGVECAWREAASGSDAPAWVPSWGGPENMMNLAYMYAHAPAPDRDLALAYASGALVAVPDWHYVRDVLVPQIEALPAAPAAAARQAVFPAE
jgi:hypothetical protein